MKLTEARALGGALLLIVGIVALATAQAQQLSDRPTEPDLFDGLWEPVPYQPAQAPASHDASFLHTHGIALADGGETPCTTCHTEESCADCHAGLSAPVAIHPPGYLSIHGAEALVQTATCATCHTTSRFCAGCHAEASAWVEPELLPPASVSVHPPGWLDPASPTNHAREARLDLMQCASCHTANTCTSCHLFVNPHGDGFRDRCGRMLDLSAPTCADCHTTDSTLPFDTLRSHPGCR